MLVTIFDTETTGLPEKTHSTFNTQKAHERSLLSMSEFKRKGNLWSTVIDKYPHIIQMAYIFPYFYGDLLLDQHNFYYFLYS